MQFLQIFNPHYSGNTTLGRFELWEANHIWVMGLLGAAVILAGYISWQAQRS
jgi:hypothetical protein